MLHVNHSPGRNIGNVPNDRGAGLQKHVLRLDVDRVFAAEAKRREDQLDELKPDADWQPV
jgi:hypothetical protein